MIQGIVKNKLNSPLSDVVIELKNADFETIYSTKTDAAGQFTLESDGEKYPYLTAVKEYGTEYLEYWCRNINTSFDINLDIIIDKLEIYGLSAFVIGGGYDSVLVYFRPMSLAKYINGESDLFPDVSKIFVSIDGVETEILECNIVNESIGESTMRAYLIQIKKKDDSCSEEWDSIEIKILDDDGNVGMAKLYR